MGLNRQRTVLGGVVEGNLRSLVEWWMLAEHFGGVAE